MPQYRRKDWNCCSTTPSGATNRLFTLAGGLGLVVTARFLDPIGRGIRDALARYADRRRPRRVRGTAFAPGTRHRRRAFIRPAAGDRADAAVGGRFRAVFWVAVISGPRRAGAGARRAGAERAAAQYIDRRAAVAAGGASARAAGGVVAVRHGASRSARFSQTFLVLRAARPGDATTAVPLVMAMRPVCTPWRLPLRPGSPTA